MGGEIILALAKVAGILLICSHIPFNRISWCLVKHPVICDLICMLVIPLPFLLFGGVRGMAAAVWFALAMSITIRVIRWQIERPTRPVTVRWWQRYNGTMPERVPADSVNTASNIVMKYIIPVVGTCIGAPLGWAVMNAILH